MRVFRVLGASLLLVTMASIRPAAASTIFLDADSLATGSGLGGGPLVVAEGTITFVGEIRDRDGDPEFTAAGALGDVFDIGGVANTALLSFSFDVSSIRFIYGGNFGGIDVTARDASNNIVATFFQADTDAGQPAGPVVLMGLGIRSLFWRDPDLSGSFAAIDNITIETAAAVPEPTSLLLLGSGVVGVISRARRRKKTIA